jgi:hypothetical protein
MNAKKEELSKIEEIASLLLTGNTKKGYSDYKLGKALNTFFKVMKNAKPGSTRADILNDAKQQIWSFLSQDNEDRKKPTIEKVDTFVSLLDELCRERYNGSLSSMYRNKNHLRSAYLWAVQAEIMRRSEANEGGTKQP